MSAGSRRSRAWEAQALGAAWFRDHGFPYATDAGAERQGRDILNLIGLACEVKAREDFNPMAYVRQAQASAAGDLPFALLRRAGPRIDRGLACGAAPGGLHGVAAGGGLRRPGAGFR